MKSNSTIPNMHLDRRRFVAIAGASLGTSMAGCFLPMDGSDLRIRNHDEREHVIDLSIVHDESTVLDESISLQPRAVSTRYTVFEKSGTYTFRASLADGTTGSATVEIADPRRDPMYHVTVEPETPDGEDERISFGRVAP